MRDEFTVVGENFKVPTSIWKELDVVGGPRRGTSMPLKGQLRNRRGDNSMFMVIQAYHKQRI